MMQTKRCTKCRRQLSIDSFRLHSRHADGHYSICRNCENEAYRAQWIAIRDEVYEVYGGGYKCACCGETNPLFLTIDHINNEGKAHRSKDIQARKLVIYLKRKGFPSGYQILCYNCNLGKARNNGICPHKSLESRR